MEAINGTELSLEKLLEKIQENVRPCNMEPAPDQEDQPAYAGFIIEETVIRRGHPMSANYETITTRKYGKR